MSLHKTTTSANNHAPWRKVFANSAARTGDVGPYTVTDVSTQVTAIQSDDRTMWVLTDESPITWTAIGGGSGGLTQSQVLTRGLGA